MVSYPHQMTIAQALDAMRQGSLSSRDLVRSCLDTIAAEDVAVQAWARLRPEAALAEADRIDALSPQARAALPLAGIPVGAKDIFYTQDLETSAGSRILQGWQPTRDAEAVRRLRAAGAILLGKTHTTEFASADPAPTRNPVDLAHTPGGSSAGSGAAVAADMCLGALGSQTAGSILRPAAYCGVVGFKPTYDAVSRDGVLPLAWSMDHVGPIAKTVEDAALLFDQIVAKDAPIRKASDRPVRIGIPDRYFDDATPSVQAALAKAMDIMRDLGWKQVPVSLPGSFEAGVAGASVVLSVEIAQAHEDWFERARDQYGPKLRGIIETGRRVMATSYLRAQRIRRLAIREVDELFTEIDFLVAPTTPAPAPLGLETTGDPRYLTPFSFFGMPALGMPIPARDTHLPVSLQLAGPIGADRGLLRAGQALERHLAGSRWTRRSRTTKA